MLFVGIIFFQKDLCIKTTEIYTHLQVHGIGCIKIVNNSMLPFFDCPEVFSLDQSVLIEFRLRLFLFPRRIGRVFIIDGGDEEEWTLSQRIQPSVVDSNLRSDDPILFIRSAKTKASTMK